MNDNWKTYKLEEIASKLGDGLHGTPKYDDAGDYYFINGSNLVNGKIVINSNTKRVTQEEYNKYKKDLSDRTILLGINGTIGNVALFNNEKCVLGKSACYINVDNKFDKQFIKYILLSDGFQNYIMTNATGTTIKNIGLKLIREYEALIPSDINEQRQIASILSSLDDKIELNQKMNLTLETIAKSIFKRWFLDFQYPGANVVIGNGLPKDLKVGSLADEFNIIMGQSPPGESYNENGEGIIFFQGRTDFGFRFPSTRIYTTDPKRFAEKFETLVSVRAPVGDLNMAIEKCSIGRGVGAVIHKTASTSFTYYFIKSIQDKIKQFDLDGTVFGSITKKNFENIEVVFPKEDIIKEFENLIKPFDNKIYLNTLEIINLTKIRDSLLPKLITGQIPVNQ